MKQEAGKQKTAKQKTGKRKRNRFILCMTLVLLLSVTVSPVSVKAAEGTVSFGSVSYEWSVGDVCPIGIYMNAGVSVNSYSICLSYDPEMLRYLNGADREEGNLIYLEGNGTEAGYKRMIHFEPLKQGETSLTVVSATGFTVTAQTGEPEEGENPAAEEESETEEITVAQLPQAPITVVSNGSSYLGSLTVGQAAGMEPFSPEKLDYHMRVDHSVSELKISCEPEDENAVVEISETGLEEGTNTIHVTVQGEGVEAVTYTLFVEREKQQLREEGAGEETAGITGEKEQPPVDKETAVTQNREPDKPEAQADTGKEGGNQEEGKEGADPGEPGNGAGEPAGKPHPEPVLMTAIVLVWGGLILNAVFFFRKRKKQTNLSGEPDWKDERLNLINLEQTVVDVKHVTMRFRLAQEEAASLKEYLIKTLKGQNRYRTLTALKDISFEVKQGDVVGIIGTNGSGKSTLLKIIAGALQPSEGEVTADRSRVQMLTLGTGFDMELTARENVYLNGAIIGYSREYIDEKYDDIVAFAELQGFMEERMKNFSSGMVSRLGFAIATMRDAPDILILDEVLSVGDMFFRKKSEKRIKEMIHSGATVLIVSHSADVICKNCDKAVWIEKGELRMAGNPKEVCQAYQGLLQ